MKRSILVALIIVLALTAGHGAGVSAQEGAARLVPTSHPPLPGDASQLWLVPDAAARAAAGRDAAAMRLARGARLIADEQYSAALPLVRGFEPASSPLQAYGQYYTAIALLNLGRVKEAASVLLALDEKEPSGYLAEAIPMQLAQAALAGGDAAEAFKALTDLSDEKLSSPEEVFLRLGTAAEAAGDRAAALDAFRRVYYDFPLSAQASAAQSGIERLETPSLVPPDRFKRELARAERLFEARRWAQARAAFVALQRAATGDTAQLVALRIAEADYYLGRSRAAREALRPYLDDGPREAEARFFYLTATRALGDTGSYVTLARRLVTDFPESDWAAETLNNLASHFIIVDEDDQADLVFREVMRRFPRHRYSERAAWRSGWWAYRDRQFAEAVQIFEQAAAAFPRSDYRPAWIYWAARSRDQAGDQATANVRYRLAVADYQNTYYGRLATRILEGRRELPVSGMLVVDRAQARGAEIRSARVIRALLAVGMYDEAIREIQYAQRVWGDSPVLQATFAWTRHQQGLGLKATDRFNALRGAINTMRRAYPQFMAAGGYDTLPPDLLRIIFPLDYWPLIKKYSDQHQLDPYLVTALMAQESTFTAEIRSHADAYGLMQLIPGTGRRVARQLGLRFTTRSLTVPETNVRLGTKYFKDLVTRFGGAHYALASYNAGEQRVARWLKESPGLAQDEFIDNIPFPETQTYVKRILGTAEDYRRLYGGGILAPAALRPTAARSTD